MFDEYNDILTVNEVCKALKIGKNTLYRLLRMGEIKSRQIGKKYLIPKICLIDYINKCRE